MSCSQVVPLFRMMKMMMEMKMPIVSTVPIPVLKFTWFVRTKCDRIHTRHQKHKNSFRRFVENGLAFDRVTVDLAMRSCICKGTILVAVSKEFSSVVLHASRKMTSLVPRKMMMSSFLSVYLHVLVVLELTLLARLYFSLHISIKYFYAVT